MHQPPAVLRRHPHHLGGAERLLAEFDRGSAVADDEMRGHDMGSAMSEAPGFCEAPKDDE